MTPTKGCHRSDGEELRRQQDLVERSLEEALLVEELEDHLLQLVGELARGDVLDGPVDLVGDGGQDVPQRHRVGVEGGSPERGPAVEVAERLPGGSVGEERTHAAGLLVHTLPTAVLALDGIALDLSDELDALEVHRPTTVGSLGLVTHEASLPFLVLVDCQNWRICQI